MKTLKLILTKRCAHVLIDNVEKNAKGYSRRELRQLDRLADSIDGECDDLMGKSRALLRKCNERLRSGEPQPVVQQEYEDEQKELNEVIGAELLEFDLGETDFDFLKSKWDGVERTSGTRDIRKIVLAIESGFEAAAKPPPTKPEEVSVASIVSDETIKEVREHREAKEKEASIVGDGKET